MMVVHGFSSIWLHTQQIPHRLCRFCLRRCGHMGVGVHSLDAYAVLEGEGVEEIVEFDFRGSSLPVKSVRTAFCWYPLLRCGNDSDITAKRMNANN